MLTIISVVFRSVYGIMTKVLSNRLSVSVYTQASLLSFSGGVLSVIISPLIGGIHFGHMSLLIVALVIAGQGLGNVAYFSAIKNLTNSTAQIAFSSILVFNTVLGLTFLSLHLSALNVFGLILLMLAILSVITGKIELHRKGVVWMLLAAFLFAVFQLASAQLSKQVSAATYLIIAYFGAAAVVPLLKWRVIAGDIQKANLSIIRIPLLTALPSLGNFLFAYYAYRSAPQPAKVAMLLTAQVVLTVALSYFFLREKSHVLRKASAAALVVVSAIFIKS